MVSGDGSKGFWGKRAVAVSGAEEKLARRGWTLLARLSTAR